MRQKIVVNVGDNFLIDIGFKKYIITDVRKLSAEIYQSFTLIVIIFLIASL